MRCRSCVGHGSSAGRALDRTADPDTGEVLGGCDVCFSQEMPCRAHRCRVCDGSGLVCPACRGDRFLQADVDPMHPDFGHAIRCKLCCPGNCVDPTRERAAIRVYLQRQQEVEAHA